jgi:transglutaminase-like putative cysteine protease
MSLIFQMPRNSLLWLLLAQAAVIFPHITRLPLWILAVWLVVLLWRIRIHRGRWSYPGWLIKIFLVALASLGIKFGYGTMLGIDPMVGLLISAFLLKLLEMQKRRDAIVVIYLGFFIAATQFLYEQTIAASLYGVFSITLMVIALLSVNESREVKGFARTAWRASKMMMQCVPLMILMFTIMPRIGALWSVPQQGAAAQTGVSDSMSPGDFTDLSRSGKLAFRVNFEGPIPARRDLYWRGLVFSEFDGRTWSASKQWLYRDGGAINWQGRDRHDWRDNLLSEGKLQHYSLILEPTNQPWLYALAMPNSIPSNAGLTRAHTLISSKPVTQRRQYRVESSTRFRLEDNITDWQRSAQTQLPEGFNPVTRARAQLWRSQEGSDQALIDRLLSHYNQTFVYTLKAPGLGKHTVDEFLWSSQRGFCEHFASSFVFFMRAAGIPARVVAGYQGGELSPAEDYLLVHQFDAHAWAEVWLEGRGWVRVDPTAAVAPSRIESGLNDALSEDDADLLGDPTSLIYYRDIAWLNQVRLQWDALNYYWYRSVVGYDQDQQSSVFDRWLGGADPWRIAAALIGGAALVLGSISLAAWWGGRRVLDPVSKAYHRMELRLRREGIQRQRGEAPRDFCERVKRDRPDLAAEVRAISVLYEKVMYGDHKALSPELQRLARKFNRL